MLETDRRPSTSANIDCGRRSYPILARPCGLSNKSGFQQCFLVLDCFVFVFLLFELRATENYKNNVLFIVVRGCLRRTSLDYTHK